jgi:polysaccharide biosynthesis/export protein
LINCRPSLLLNAVAFMGVMVLMSSCGNTRQLTYIQGSFDTAKLSQVNPVEPIIRKGDILSIIVFSDNLPATQPYNQVIMATPGSVSSSGNISGNGGATSGYQVDDKGNIVFPLIGSLHIEGLTKGELKDTLDSRLDTLLSHPYYNIRFLNYKFTMLGELNKPGEVTIPGERVNMLEALALAGDMTIYGRRDNILVIRESNGKREFARLDITKPEIMQSPFYYLQQNDIVYVEATAKKIRDPNAIRNLTIVTSVVSTFAILYTIFK